MRVRIGDYSTLQSRLGDVLNAIPGGAWSLDHAAWDGDGTYDSGGGFSGMLPLVLARRSGPALLRNAREHLRARPQSEHDWLKRIAAGWSLEPDDVRIDVFDLGMAVVNATFSVSHPALIDHSSSAETLYRMSRLRPDDNDDKDSPVAMLFRCLAAETTDQLSAALELAVPQARVEPWLAPFLRARQLDREDRPCEWGRILWIHPVHLHKHHSPVKAALVSHELAPTFSQTLAVPGGSFTAGVGWSAIVTGRPRDAVLPMRLLELHWAYHALYLEIDRGLLAVLDDDRWHVPSSLAELEADADRVFASYMRVMEARARLDSCLASLGGDEFAVWEALDAVTKFTPLVDGVDRKVQALQQVAERRVQQSTANRARRANIVLSALTALTIVTVAIALTGNFVGSRADQLGHTSLRVGVVLVALAAALTLYREAHRDRQQHYVHRK